jgi:hypothetical protein
MSPITSLANLVGMASILALLFTRSLILALSWWRVAVIFLLICASRPQTSGRQTDIFGLDVHPAQIRLLRLLYIHFFIHTVTTKDGTGQDPWRCILLPRPLTQAYCNSFQSQPSINLANTQQVTSTSPLAHIWIASRRFWAGRLAQWVAFHKMELCW